MKIKSIDEYGIFFDNGNTLKDYHSQDCCERVYADWTNVQVITKINQNYIDSNSLEFDEDLEKKIHLIPDVGFEIESQNGIRLLVSCYNVQNGYYSSDLELQYVKAHPQLLTIDISHCVKDDIC